jgi:ATP-dependent exoDNAse (exonuclease V) alpha subunit
MTRNWIYTAISRASKVCVLVGQRGEIPKIVKRNRPTQRNTSLKGFLQSSEFPS